MCRQSAEDKKYSIDSGIKQNMVSFIISLAKFTTINQWYKNTEKKR